MTTRTKGRTALYSAAAVGVVVALFIGVLATRDPAYTRVAPSRLIGRAAPDVSGPTVAGERFTLSAQSGKYVLVNFFATWCVPCVEEHPHLMRFAERDDVTVVSVVYQDEREDIERFFAKEGGDWPVVEDANAKVDWGVRGVPESFLVAPDGVVVNRIIGGIRFTPLVRLLEDVKAARGDGQ